MNKWLKRLSGSRHTLPLVVFLGGLVITVLCAQWLEQDIQTNAHNEFDRHTQRLAEEVTRRFEQPVYGLKGVRGVYAAKDGRVNRQEFRNYVESRDLDREFPGVRGFGFVQRVLRSELPEFLDQERADGERHFTVRELTNNALDDLYIIKFIEPGSPNHAAQGLDLGSEPRRREGAELAVSTGEPALTSVISLVRVPPWRRPSRPRPAPKSPFRPGLRPAGGGRIAGQCRARDRRASGIRSVRRTVAFPYTRTAGDQHRHAPACQHLRHHPYLEAAGAGNGLAHAQQRRL
jgi:CHASE domain